MPIKNAAKKALRQTKKRYARNTELKDTMRTLIKKFTKAVAANKTEDAKPMIPALYKAIDKSAKGHIIKANKAARIKSRVSRMLNKLVAAPAKAK